MGDWYAGEIGEPAALRRIVALDSDSILTRVAFPSRSIGTSDQAWDREASRRLATPRAAPASATPTGRRTRWTPRRGRPGYPPRPHACRVSCEHHHHRSARPDVLDVVLQVLLLVAERPNQRPLKLGKKLLLGARGIRAVEVLFPMEDVDVVQREPGLQQCLDGNLSQLRIDDAPHDAIGWIRDVRVWLAQFTGHSGCDWRPDYTRSASVARS